MAACTTSRHDGCFRLKHSVEDISHQEARPSLLLVEDDMLLRSRCARALRARGIDVIEAASAREAILLASQTQPQNALVDLHLGDGSGLDVVRAIKKLSSQTDIVMWTGASTRRLIVSARQAGAMTVLNKPVSIERILHAFPRLR